MRLCMTGCLCFVRFSATAQGRHLHLCDYCGENINNGITKTDEVDGTIETVDGTTFFVGEENHAVLKDDFISGLCYYPQSPSRRSFIVN